MCLCAQTQCRRLWCTSPEGAQRGCRTQHMPWADGTDCSPGKVNAIRQQLHDSGRKETSVRPPSEPLLLRGGGGRGGLKDQRSLPFGLLFRESDSCVLVSLALTLMLLFSCPFVFLFPDLGQSCSPFFFSSRSTASTGCASPKSTTPHPWRAPGESGVLSPAVLGRAAAASRLRSANATGPRERFLFIVTRGPPDLRLRGRKVNDQACT